MSELVLFPRSTESAPDSAQNSADEPGCEPSLQSLAPELARSGPPISNASVRPLSTSEREVLEDAIGFASDVLADDICAALFSDDVRAREDAQALLPLLAVGGDASIQIEATVFEAMWDAERAHPERMQLAVAWRSTLYDASRRDTLLRAASNARVEDREIAVSALSAPGCQIGAGAARTALTDEHDTVRLAAFRALIETALGDDVELLLSVAPNLNADDLEVSLGALLDLCTSTSAAALLDHLSAQECADKRRLSLLGQRLRPVRCAAARAVAALADADARNRMLALSLLERDGTRLHLEPVLPLLGDDHPRVRALARDVAHALRRRGGEGSEAAL